MKNTIKEIKKRILAQTSEHFKKRVKDDLNKLIELVKNER